MSSDVMTETLIGTSSNSWRDTARGHNDFTGFFRGFSRSGGCRESRGGERGDEREMMLSLHLLLIPCWNRDPLHGVPSL